MHEQQMDVAIVGAGAVGCALACALAQAHPDLRIALLEAAPVLSVFREEDFDPRVYALSATSIAWLQSLSVWPDVAAARACPYRRMSVWDGQSNGAIAFDCEDLHLDQLGYIVENSVLLAALRARVEAYANVQLLAPCKVESLVCDASGEHSRLGLDDGRQLRAAMIIGADGARSAIRRLAGFETRSWGYEQSALVATVRTAKPHDCTAFQRFTEHGALAFLPLSVTGASACDSRFSSIVWSLDDRVANRIFTLPDEEFLLQLEQSFESRLGAVDRVSERHLLPLQQMHAVNYALPGIALVGDAAHTIHPLAGQGINLGFYDAMALSREVSRALERGVPVHHPSVAKRYVRQRKSHNLAAMAAMEGFKSLFSARQSWLVALRSSGLKLTDRQSWLKRSFMQAAAGPGLELTER